MFGLVYCWMLFTCVGSDCWLAVAVCVYVANFGLFVWQLIWWVLIRFVVLRCG